MLELFSEKRKGRSLFLYREGRETEVVRIYFGVSFIKENTSEVSVGENKSENQANRKKISKRERLHLGTSFRVTDGQ